MDVTIPALILFTLATAGLTRIVTHADLTAPLRDLWDDRLAPHLPAHLQNGIHCAQCVGAWSGLLCGLLTLPNGPATALAALFAGALIGSLAAWLIAVLGRFSA